MELVPNWRTTARAFSFSGPASFPFMVQIQSLKCLPSNEGSMRKRGSNATAPTAHTLKKISMMRMQDRFLIAALCPVHEGNREFSRPERKKIQTGP
jgi:hypothetical protein